MTSKTSPTNRRQIRIQYVEKLSQELEGIEKSFHDVSCNIPDEISDIKKRLTDLLEYIEDIKPYDPKNFSKINQKMLESESKINKLSTELKDIQFRGIGSGNQSQRLKDIEKELQFHKDRVRDLKLSQQQFQSNNNNLNQARISSPTTTNTNTTSTEPIQKLKTTSKSIIDSIQKLYKYLDEFSKDQLMIYFNTLNEVIHRIPELRGGIDIGILRIGADEAVEVLERMNDYIYQSSKSIFQFFSELPTIKDSQSYQLNLGIYHKTIENLEKQSRDGNNGDIKDIIIKPHKFLMDIFKKKHRSPPIVNLIEKISIRENYNDQQQQQQKQQLKKKEKKENTKPKYTNETILSIQIQIDAVLADLNNFIKFPEKDIIVNLLLPMESKCKMLLEVLDTFKSRFSYYQEKIQVWIDYNSTILRVSSYESDSGSFKFKDFKSLGDIQSKLKIILKVLHVHLTSCPIAIPMIYLTESSWKLSSYPDFRAHQRKEIEKLLLVIKSNHNPIDVDTVRKCTLEFTDILIAVLNIQIPLMIEVFQDDSTLFKTKNWSNERKHMLSTVNETIHSLKYISTTNSQTLIDLLNSSVKMIQSVLLQFFTYKPIARPNVYKSDSEWKLLNESKLRYEFRTSILI